MKLLKCKITEIWIYENIEEFLVDREIKRGQGYKDYLSVHTKDDKIKVEYRKQI